MGARGLGGRVGGALGCCSVGSTTRYANGRIQEDGGFAESRASDYGEDGCLCTDVAEEKGGERGCKVVE